MLSSLAPARRRLVLTVLGLATASVVAGVVAIAVHSDASSRSTSAANQGVLGPVLLVPGYGGSTNSLQPLASALRATGRVVTVVALPDHARGDLLAQARVLHIAVRTAMATSKATSVDVVGYSAGGVVARLWARDLGGAAVARRIVTLSSPQHGTQLASLGTLLPAACPTACQELATGSDLLAALNVGDETPPGPEWVSLWTTHDTVVLPPDSASLDGALDLTVQSLCPSDTVDHTGLPQDPVTIRVVLASLGRTLKRASPGC